MNASSIIVNDDAEASLPEGELRAKGIIKF
jgi:hypothetical protein